MDEETDIDDERVNVSMELTGRYDDIVSKLEASETEDETLSALTADLSILLETVSQLGGGTRSAIAQELPAGMEESYDAQAVVETLQVLERYDLVVLEGNTWKPGSELREQRSTDRDLLALAAPPSFPATRTRPVRTEMAIDDTDRSLSRRRHRIRRIQLLE